MRLRYKLSFENIFPLAVGICAVVGAGTSLLIAAPVTLPGMLIAGAAGVMAGGIGLPVAGIAGFWGGKILAHFIKNYGAWIAIGALALGWGCARILFVTPFQKIRSLFSKKASPSSTTDTHAAVDHASPFRDGSVKKDFNAGATPPADATQPKIIPPLLQKYNLGPVVN